MCKNSLSSKRPVVPIVSALVPLEERHGGLARLPPPVVTAAMRVGESLFFSCWQRLLRCSLSVLCKATFGN